MPKGQTRNRSQRKTTGQFRLTQKASARMAKYITEIQKGIVNVCEMHTHDVSPSLDQQTFEITYIDKLLGQVVTGVRLSLRAMTDGLTKQREALATVIHKEEDIT